MNTEEIKLAIRKRHKLADGADVRIIASSLTLKGFEESDPYKFTARMTTDSLDRQNEVVLPQGGDMKEFLATGIVSFNHDYSSPVGFPNKNKAVIRGENFIEAGMVFMKRPADYQREFFPDFARAFVTQATEAGIRPGVSIGFIPIESRLPSKADRERWGGDIQLVHSKWKLLELAIAPVQANQDAVVTAVGKGLMKREVAKAVGIVVPDTIVVKAPTPAPAPRPIVEHIVCVVRSRRGESVGEIAAKVDRQVTNTLMKAFGKLYA